MFEVWTELNFSKDFHLYSAAYSIGLQGNQNSSGLTLQCNVAYWPVLAVGSAAQLAAARCNQSEWFVLQPSRLSEVSGGRVTGVALCPFSPLQNSTSLMTSLDDLYTATVTDFTARDPAIYRALGPSKHLRTVQYNSRWLNGKYLFIIRS